MQTDMDEETRQTTIDTLIAISVVAKVLAEKLRRETTVGEPNESNE